MRPLTVLLLAASLAGCARLQPLLGRPLTDAPQTGDAASLRGSVNDLAVRRTATVQFVGGRTVRAGALYMDLDSTTWRDAETGRRGVAATRTVYRVVFQKRRLRAGEGIVGGFMAGIVGGAVIGYLAPGSSDAWFDTRQSNAALGAVGLGIAGAAVGGLASAGSGGETTFEFKPSD